MFIYIYIYYTSAKFHKQNGTPSLSPAKFHFTPPRPCLFDEGTEDSICGHKLSWKCLASCLDQLFKVVDEGTCWSFISSKSRVLVRWKSIQRQLQPNFVVYNRHARNHTSKHPICEKRQPFKSLSGWWQLKHILFSPLLPGEMIQFDEHICQMGWFNHQFECLVKGLDISNHSNPIHSFRCFVSGSKDLPNGGDGTFWCLTQDTFDSGHLWPWVNICF